MSDFSRTPLPNSARIIPGILAGIYWPKMGNGVWMAQEDILLAIPGDDDGYEWMIAIPVQRHISPIPVMEIIEACQRWPKGWTLVKEGGPYPMSEPEKQTEVKVA